MKPTSAAIFALAVTTIAACGDDARPRAADGELAVADVAAPLTAEQRQFLAHYADRCGQTFTGRTVMVDLGPDHPLEGASLTMTLERCTEDEVRIPFHVNGDRSRTWILTVTEEGLRLAHDHRHPDGTEYEANFYGGYADDRGTGTKQFFPADARTIADRPAREVNVWSKEFDLENGRYYYRLYLQGELRYEGEFDLD